MNAEMNQAADNSVLWPTSVFTGYSARLGWDPVTGWGSPDAQYLVRVPWP